MAKQLLGKEVTAALNEKIKANVAELQAKGVDPTLCIIRVGENPSDISYERGATKRCETLGVACEKILLPEDVTQEVFFALYKKLDRLKLSENIRIWLYRAADLEIKNYIRHNPSFVSLEECSDEISAAPIDFPFLSDNDLDCLSDKDKAIISDYYNGEDKESIAKANEMTLNALYIHIHRIRKRLAVSARKAKKLRL